MPGVTQHMELKGQGELPFPLGTLPPEWQICPLWAEGVTDLSQMAFARAGRVTVEASGHAVCPEGLPLLPLHELGR